MSEYKNIWAFVETENGKAKKVGLERVVGGRKLADAVGEVVAVVIGSGVDDAAKAAVSMARTRSSSWTAPIMPITILKLIPTSWSSL